MFNTISNDQKCSRINEQLYFLSISISIFDPTYKLNAFMGHQDSLYVLDYLVVLIRHLYL